MQAEVKTNLLQLISFSNNISITQQFDIAVDAQLSIDLIINAGSNIKMNASNKAVALPSMSAIYDGLRGIVYNSDDSLFAYNLLSIDNLLINKRPVISLGIGEYAIVYYKHSTTEWLLIE